MKIKLKKEILTEMREAYPDNPVYEKDEYGFRSGKTIETKFLSPAEVDRLVEIYSREENTEDIDDRRQFRKLSSFVKLMSGKAKKIKNLNQMTEALVMLIRPLKRHWVFVEDEVSGAMVPYFVTKVRFHEADHRGGYPAYISFDAKGMRRGAGSTFSKSINREDLGPKGCSPEWLMESLGIFPETDELAGEYEKDLAYYNEVASQTGLQVIGHGNCNRIENRNSWRHSYDSVSLDKGGMVSKLVMDDEEEREDKCSSVVSSEMWSAKHGSDGEEADVFQLPVQTFVRVFSLKTHEFLGIHIRNVETYEYEEGLENKLVLDDDKRELIDLLVSSGGDDSRDIVQGKSGGVIIVTSGPPGTGKTLTAEVYSEKVKRPLYVVQCSQLGTDPDDLEKMLEKVLDRAVRWNAVLLIDEADVYIHERGDDIQQNAIVGVFLRVLEYYSGVLFLTTNRATVIDDAIESRCIAHVKYELPTEGERTLLWTILSKQYGVPFEGELVETLVESFPDISGRSIKQLIRLAKARASSREEEITADTVAWVSRFQKMEVPRSIRKKYPVLRD